jgi:Tol biopolymer transport system component
VSIPAGTRLGPYEIVGLLGAGGMGEVHRARDTRLGRDVAIKTLPAGLAADPERLRRFEIEAVAASQLSHPNIVSVYDIGTTDGQPYIVSELLDGETLRERLGRGPLAPRRAVEIGVAIAEALAAAHARGIVHRDLKPENLFLQRDGRPKILDFGIAKLTTAEPANPAAAATVSALTEAGVAVGTLGYMAPEQVRGEPVDHRTDIFAFGAVLHEMIAGTPAFRRDSRIATVNAVLEADPPELADAVAPALRRIIQRCVEKAPDLRFQSARDLAFALDALSDRQSGTTATSTAGRPARVDWRWAAIAVLAAALIGAFTWIARSPAGAPPAQVRRFLIGPPPGATVNDVAVSPDGRHLVMAVTVASTTISSRLYLRSFDNLEARDLPGTDGAHEPFVSPDGAWVGFASLGKLKKVALSGGSPVAIGDVRNVLGASWGPNGEIVVAQREQGLSVVSAEGGPLRPLTTPDTSAGEIDHHAPSVLADGSAVIFTIHAGPGIFRIATRSLTTGVQRTVVPNGFDGRMVASGHLMFARGDSLYAAPFDAARLDLTGEPVAVVEGVSTAVEDGAAFYDAAADGTLAYRPAEAPEERSLVWIDRKGRSETIPTPRRAFRSPALSPDGRRIAVEVAEGPRSDVWIFEFGTGSFSRLTTTGLDGMPLWSTDGQRLAYGARRDEERHIMWQPLDGSAAPESLVRSRNRIWPSAWTPDGKSLVFVEDPPTSLPDIKLLKLDDRTVSPLVAGPEPEMMPSVSPDGRWIVYTRFDKSPHVMVRPFAGGAAREITPDGGGAPRWLANGREIVSRTLTTFRSVRIQTTPEFSISQPEVLFPWAVRDSLWQPHHYDVAPDGSRFLFIHTEPATIAPPGVAVVEQFFSELRRRAPVRR